MHDIATVPHSFAQTAPMRYEAGMERPCPQGPFSVFAARRAKAGYHHGNLKQTLLDAAETLIAERGPAGVNLSEMARMAGVSSAAIYRHYADLSALIGAVARRGFEDFTLRLSTTVPGPGPEGFRGMGDAYLAFARERPGAYAAMFSSTITYTDPELAAAGERAFNTLVNGLTKAVASIGISPQTAFTLAIQIWSLAHGVATLAGTGRLSPATGVVPEAVLREGVEALIRSSVPSSRQPAP